MDEPLEKLHNLAYLIGALACASEKNIGDGSHSVCSLAGKKFGCDATKNSVTSDDPLKAIEILHDALKAQGIVWDFEPFLGEQTVIVDEKSGVKKIRMVFNTCMVRNALFRYSHEQKQSLCSMAHGVFAGAMQKVFPGCKATLEIIHAGPNACLKELILEADA